ncbi:MAG: serine/threonine protein kinase [Labilithrix sp.]|nr:serine/threonine protein kinase [Labilithrix sp.]
MIGAGRDPRSEATIEGTGTTAFGKYQLFASLGRGGMADVFLSVARGQMGFNKLAVIKRLRQALAEESAFRNMFLDEARLAARLSHPNIVHTYEVGEQGGVYFIAMEYLEGQSLNKVLKETLRRKETLEPEIAVRVVADALAGLGYAHELRDYDGRPLSVIHRDISPHNIFVTYDGHTKLVDFGIAKAALSSTETEVGVLKGKVAYMSPEQAMGQRIDARSDLFAMGIVLWELIAQQRLMTGESAANTLHKLMNEPIPRLSQVLPRIDPNLEMLVARALEKEPEHRWQSASEMRGALESWLAAHPRQTRQDDVGRRMMALFGSVREEVQRQIQKHMAALTPAANTQELQALTAESLKRMEQSGANVSGQLLRLGTSGSGSGSGVIASYGGLPPPSGYPSAVSSASHAHAHAHAPPPAPMPAVAPAPAPKSSSALLIVVTIGCFLLAGLLIVVLGLRDRKPGLLAFDDPPAATSAQPTGETTTAPPESATAGGTGAPPVATTPPSSTSATPAPATAAPVKTAHAAHPPAPRTATVPKTSTPPPPPPPAEEPGFVTVSAYPWAKVTEGGKVICAVTPCNKVSMSPGTHSLTFENGESPGQKQTVTVQVRSGETSTKNVGFK